MFWDCLSLLPSVLFGYHIIFSHNVSFSSPWLWQFLRFTLFLMTLTLLWRTGYVVYRMSFSWDLSDGFLMIASELCVFRRKTAEVNCHFSSFPYAGYIQSTWLIIVEVNFDRLAEGVYAIFICCEDSPNPILLYFLGRKSPLHRPHSGAGSYVPCLWGHMYVCVYHFQLSVTTRCYRLILCIMFPWKLDPTRK